MRLKFEGDPINVYSGDKCGFIGCEQAFNKRNTCRCALSYECCAKLKEEHGVPSFRQERTYKFPGCKNHSFKEMDDCYDGEGAYWCTSNKKKTMNTIHVCMVVCTVNARFYSAAAKQTSRSGKEEQYWSRGWMRLPLCR